MQPFCLFSKSGTLPLLIILLALVMTSCQSQSAGSPDPSPTASPILTFVTPTFPSSATAACVPLRPGMSVSATPVTHTFVKVDLKGFQPGENVTFTFFTQYGTTTNGYTAGPTPVDKDGSYSLNQSLSVVPDRSKIHWQVQVIYSSGAACSEIEMPDP